MNAALTKNPRKRPGPSRPYVFAVTAMAVLLALLAWQHPRGSETVAEAKLKFSRHANPGGDPVVEPAQIEAVLQELKSGAAMTAAIGELDPAWLSENLPPSTRDAGTPADRLAERLFFRLEPAASEPQFDVCVRFMGGTDTFALRFVEEVTGQFERMHNNVAAVDKAAQAVAAADKELHRLATRIDELQLQRTDYIETEVAAARDRHEVQLQAERLLAFPAPEPETIDPVSSDAEPQTVEVADAAAAPQSQLPIVEELNPEWTRLSERLQDLEAELVGLRQRLTPAHPDFARLKSEKEDVAARLADTPQFISAQTMTVISQIGPATPASETPVASLPAPEPVPEPEPVEPEVPVFDEQGVRQEVATSAIGQRLEQQIATAKADRVKQQQRWEQLTAEQPAYRETTQRVGQPQVIRRYSEPLSTTQLWFTMGISVVAGVVVSSLRTKSQLPETLCSIADVEKSLQLRSMGGITTKDGPAVASPAPSRLPWFASGLVHSSEAVLCAAIAMVVFVAVSVPGFGGQFLENPFSAFAFAFDQISSYWV